MFTKYRALILLAMIQQITFSQSENPSMKKFYSNGRVKIEVTEKGHDTIEYKKYYRNGQLKDSVWLTYNLKREYPIGIERTYYKNGILSSVTFYTEGHKGYSRYKYFASGILSDVTSMPFGIQKSYNSKGDLIRQLDINKNDQIYVPKKYKNHIHLTESIYSAKKLNKKIYLTNTTQKIFLKPGVLTSIYINGTDSLLEHCIIEGTFNDSIIISKFNYDLSLSKNKLKLDSVFAVNISDLNIIYYSKKNTRKRYYTALICEITGVDLVIIPIVLLTVTGNFSVIADPAILSMIGSGIATYIVGRNLYKKMIPKKYDMSEWKITAN